MEEIMIPDEHLRDVIDKYWNTEEKKVNDYDFRQEAFLAQLILELRRLISQGLSVKQV